MNKRRWLSLILAIVMVVALLPTSALAAGKAKTKDVSKSIKISGKNVKVTLKDVPSKTKLTLGKAGKSAYYNAVDNVVDGEFKTVLAVKAKANPGLKQATTIKVTAAAL